MTVEERLDPGVGIPEEFECEPTELVELEGIDIDECEERKLSPVGLSAVFGTEATQSISVGAFDVQPPVKKSHPMVSSVGSNLLYGDISSSSGFTRREAPTGQYTGSALKQPGRSLDEESDSGGVTMPPEGFTEIPEAGKGTLSRGLRETNAHVEVHAKDSVTEPERKALQRLINDSGIAASGITLPRLIMADEGLKERYQFAEESIQVGAITLIFALDKNERRVVLRQVWSALNGPMPEELATRVELIAGIKHPQLLVPNKVFQTDSGCWAEFSRPPGFRLSDVIATNGPQNILIVKQWARQAASVIEAVHEAHVAYANLTLDAIWVQEHGPLHLEPFDVLAFEDRGDLGPFGPPELRVSNAQPRLSPATDVYSLAAVSVAMLTGLPYSYQKVQEVTPEDERDVLEKALRSDPSRRFSTVSGFVDAFVVKRTDLSFAANKSLYLIGILALVIVISSSALLILHHSDEKSQFGLPIAGEPPAAKVAPPGPVKRFAIVTIDTSYVTNPPLGSGFSPNVEKLALEVNELSKEGKKKDLKDQEDRNEELLAAIADFQRGFTDPFTQPISNDDWVIINKYNRLPGTYPNQETVLKLFTKAVEEKDFAAFRLHYQELAKNDPAALMTQSLLNDTDWGFVSLQMDRNSVEQGDDAKNAVGEGELGSLTDSSRENAKGDMASKGGRK